jgi:hypothetical protein
VFKANLSHLNLFLGSNFCSLHIFRLSWVGMVAFDQFKTFFRVFPGFPDFFREKPKLPFFSGKKSK